MDEQLRETKRAAIHEASKGAGNKQRHGLFTQPMPNCIGETNMFKKKESRRDEEGHVILAPRNFTTKKTKLGRTDNVYFEKPSYVSVTDPFKTPVEKVLRTEDTADQKALHEEVKFKPAKHVIERYYTSSYKNMPENVHVKKDYKDADGVVVTAPKNFYTTPAKQGQVGKGTYFNKQVEHMADDFNYPKKLAQTEMKAGKLLE